MPKTFTINCPLPVPTPLPDPNLFRLVNPLNAFAQFSTPSLSPVRSAANKFRSKTSSTFMSSLSCIFSNQSSCSNRRISSLNSATPGNVCNSSVLNSSKSAVKYCRESKSRLQSNLNISTNRSSCLSKSRMESLYNFSPSYIINNTISLKNAVVKPLLRICKSDTSFFVSTGSWALGIFKIVSWVLGIPPPPPVFFILPVSV